MFKATLLSLSSLMLTTDARVSFGSCPEVKVMSGFDQTRYIGKWYEQVRDYTNAFTPFTMCVTMEFGPIRADNSFEQNYRGLYWPILWYGNNDGVYYQCGEDANLKWTCQATMGGGTVRGDIPIFYTDYDNYKILYGCSDVLGGLMKYEYFSMYARDPKISDSAMELAKAKIKELVPQYDLDWNWWNLEWTWQGAICDYESGWKFDS